MSTKKDLSYSLGQLNYLLTRKLNQQHLELKTGITAEQFRLLGFLWKEDGVTQQQLATLLARDRAGVTRMVDILEEQGFITRIPAKDDRRVNLIYLTKKGKAVEKEASDCSKSVMAATFKGFTKKEQAELMRLLEKAAGNLG